MVTLDELRVLFPEREFPTDEEVAVQVAEKEMREAEEARIAAEREEAEAAKARRIEELERELAELKGEDAQG